MISCKQLKKENKIMQDALIEISKETHISPESVAYLALLKIQKKRAKLITKAIVGLK